MVWVVDLNYIEAVDVYFLYIRIVKIVRKDAKPGHVLIDSLDNRHMVKFLPASSWTQYFRISVLNVLAASALPSAEESSMECFSAMTERTSARSFE
jgi:hypothetical protein